ncbi:DUF5059 domain-containing protein [Halopiger djelfimassiliensis]|uniref:DUF5059 domain-containing protein n=1 Tax=Halopiger djelfimassiliensis TaxID=1293047 RepID=UPI000677935A|nr:DUF5059 domain-containing protein [Halopiger djelfimassiliensis]
MPTRRTVLAASVVAATTGVAGCTDGTDDDSDEEADADGESNGDGGSNVESPAIGVAAEWNAIRARTADALALGVAGEFSTGGAVVSDTLARFEGATAEWGAHEQLEETDHESYEEFEEALEELKQEGLDESDLERIRTEVGLADEQLQSVQHDRLGAENALALDMGQFAARINDVATLAAAGQFAAAETVAEGIDEAWEDSNAHDAVSDADSDLYSTFEGAVIGLASAAADEDAEAVRDEAETAIPAAIDAAYVLAEDEAVADAAGIATMQARGWDAAVLTTFDVAPETAADIARGAYQWFESARVHESLESADHATYEAFEDELEAYIETLETEATVDEAAADFAAAALRAQFAVAGALEDAPGEGDGDHGHEHGDEHADLEGGPNVVEGVPDDVDHVVKMHATSFEPENLTVASGDTVAFEHVGGEPHTVTAYEDGIPADAAYWASGDFESEQRAREGWENGVGAVRSGQSYVRTFETTGEHEYVCLPHETVEMTGTIVVE